MHKEIPLNSSVSAMDTVYDRRASSLFTTSLILFFVGIVFFAALLNDGRDLAILSIIVFGLVGAMKLWAQIQS
jgi:ABC-type proline/glycine betaine transport system permease subunit